MLFISNKFKKKQQNRTVKLKNDYLTITINIFCHREF